MRLSGLASGMDTDSMIKEMMKVERTKVDKLTQDKQILSWRQETFNSLNKDLVNFILDSKKKFGVKTNYSGSISYRDIDWSKTATVGKDFKSTATALPSAMDGKHTINVERMAEGVTAVSNDNITTGTKKDVITNQFTGFGENEIIEFKIKGKNGEVTFKIGNSADGTANKSEEDDVKNNIIRITKPINSVSLSEIVTKINNATVSSSEGSKSLGMKASYDSNLDRFFIQTRDTGTDATMGFEAVAGSKGEEFLTALKLNMTSFDADVKSTEALDLTKAYKGINAKVDYSIDGAIVKKGIEYQSNNFTVNGINFTAKEVKEVEITISTNADEVFNKVKEFIEGYNKIVDKMNSLVSEKTYRSFKPLTSEQKEAMSEEEVNLWEAKAKSGLVKGDEIITRTMQTVRSGIYDVVDGVNGAYNHITQIGITTEKYVSGAAGGKLEINEARLKEAIANDANGVLDLLFKSPTGSLDTDDDNLTADNLKLKRKESGIVTRIYHNLAAGMKNIVEKAGVGQETNLLREVRARITQDFATKHGSKSLLDKNIFDYDKRIDRMNVYLSNREQFYYNKFTAMEKAMQRANSQSSWLTQQLGGGM